MSVEEDWENHARLDSNPEYWRVGRRRRLLPGEPDWEPYTWNHPFPQVTDLRTIDGYFNPVREGTYFFSHFDDLASIHELLGPLESDREYYQIFTDGLIHPDPHLNGLKFLGYDLSDETMTSSLTNCGLWNGPLESVAHSVNHHGLLDLENAKEARRLLPIENPQDPHSYVTIWAVYEWTPEEFDWDRDYEGDVGEDE